MARSRCVLIVEDRRYVRLLLEATLDDGSWRFMYASTGRSALLKARAFRPFLILLDIGLEGPMDGLEICRQLKNSPETAGILIAIISGRAEKADIAAGLLAGADAYFTKPFSPLSILEWVDQVRERVSKMALVLGPETLSRDDLVIGKAEG
jgi:DNA-binding response OmpR family regulator